MKSLENYAWFSADWHAVLLAMIPNGEVPTVLRRRSNATGFHYRRLDQTQFISWPELDILDLENGSAFDRTRSGQLY